MIDTSYWDTPQGQAEKAAFEQLFGGSPKTIRDLVNESYGQPADDVPDGWLHHHSGSPTKPDRGI